MLEFRIDFNALQEIRYLFQQEDAVLQRFILAAELLRDVERRLFLDFYPQLQTKEFYEFNEADLYELARDPNCYALTESTRKALAESVDVELTPAAVLNEIRKGFQAEGFSRAEGDLVLYVVLQTRGGILNILGGSLNGAFCGLCDTEAFGLVHIRKGKRQLQGSKVRGTILVSVTEELAAAHESGEIWNVAAYSFQLQVGPKLLVREAILQIKHEAIAVAVSRSLSVRVFPITHADDKIIFNLDSRKIAALVRNSSDEAAKTFMALCAIYSQPARVDYCSRLKDGRTGERGLCLDIIDICITYKYEFEVGFFALGKLLELLLIAKEKFSKELVPLQFFSLPNFSIEKYLCARELQFIEYLSSLRPEDINEGNAIAVASIVTSLLCSAGEFRDQTLPFLDSPLVVRGVITILARTIKLGERGVEILNKLLVKEVFPKFTVYMDDICKIIIVSRNEAMAQWVLAADRIYNNPLVRLTWVQLFMLSRTAGWVHTLAEFGNAAGEDQRLLRIIALPKYAGVARIIDEARLPAVGSEVAEQKEREWLVITIVAEVWRVLSLPTVTVINSDDFAHQSYWNIIIAKHFEEDLRMALECGKEITRPYLEFRFRSCKLQKRAENHLFDFILSKVAKCQKIGELVLSELDTSGRKEVGDSAASSVPRLTTAEVVSLTPRL